MVVMEKRLEPTVGPECGAELTVERTDISFSDLPGDRVQIHVTVHNGGSQRSLPTMMRLESAPLGAFVRWRSLTQVRVPALEPGESRELSAVIDRPRPDPLGDFDRVPPARLLTAVSAANNQPPSDAGFESALTQFILRQSDPRRGVQSASAGLLAPDLWDWLGRGQPHWAGNINVFVGRKSVERHHAKALRIYPGRTNFAVFVVGNPGRRDAFAFELVGLAPDWKAALYDMTKQSSLLISDSDEPLAKQQWVETVGGLMMTLAIRPPADCSAGNLEVRVTRRGSEKSALVEFSLDPDALGPGCYIA